MKLKLIERKDVAPNVQTFIFEAPEAITWRAGQYQRYVLDHPDPDDRNNERWFTISNAPYTGHPSITTRFADENGSSFKEAMKKMKPGDEIESDGVEGDFVIDDPSKQYIFIAGGIGITPFHSILTQLDHDKKPINIELLYANRDEQFPFDDEFQAIASRNLNFNVHKFVGSKHIESADIKEMSSQLTDPEYFISGPVPMVEAFAKKLKDMNVPENKIHIDDFPGYEKI